MSHPLRFSFALFALLSACASPPLDPDASASDSATPTDDGAATPMDAGGDGAIAPPADSATPPPDAPFVPSGCPMPATLAPSPTVMGHLPAVDVDFVRTVDGDTAHFMIAGVETVVRFLYVNAEETSGADATAFGRATVPLVDRMLRSSRLQISAERATNGQPARDAFGRTLALVFANGELVQTRIIREGLSAYYTQFGCAPAPVHSALLYAEAEARANRRGIWAPGHPTNYADVFMRWFGRSTCRPNPFLGQPYCR